MKTAHLVVARGVCAGMLVLLWGLIGCSEGYEAKEADMVDVHRMSNTQRLKLMNALGREAHGERRWRYKLDEACNIHVSREGSSTDDINMSFALSGASFTYKSDKEDSAHDVRVSKFGGNEDEALSILESERWHHAAEMVSIVKFIQRDCQPEAIASGRAAVSNRLV